MRRAVATLLLATGCATVPVAQAPAVEEPCHVWAVSSAVPLPPGEPLGMGVWMCPELAALKAGNCAKSEKGYQECQEKLRQTEGWPWQAIVTGIVVGAVAGGVTVASVYELRDWLRGK